MEKEEIEEILKNVSDSYYDFVVGARLMAQLKKNGIEEMINFIKNNPESRTDDILEFVDSLEFDTYGPDEEYVEDDDDDDEDD